MAPAGWFILGLIDGFTFNLTNAFFEATAMLGMTPCGCLGLFFSARGMRMAYKSKYYQKKDIGYANLLMGGIMLIAGIIAAGAVYVITG